MGPEPGPAWHVLEAQAGPRGLRGAPPAGARTWGPPFQFPKPFNSPGSRAGPGAAAPRGHALSTRASALALPVVAASACALRIPRSDSAKNNKSPPPAARHRLPSTDTASGIARRGASPPRPPRRPRPSSDHAPVTHPSSLTTTTPSLDACRRHAPGGRALLCQSLTPPRSFHVQLSPC